MGVGEKESGFERIRLCDSRGLIIQLKVRCLFGTSLVCQAEGLTAQPPNVEFDGNNTTTF